MTVYHWRRWQIWEKAKKFKILACQLITVVAYVVGYQLDVVDLTTFWSYHILSGMCTRPSKPRLKRDPRPMSPRPRRDVAASETLAETLKLRRLAETFSVTYGETHWHWEKLYALINSHHGKRFLFVILWVFALYFDNYHWIINGLHHKELQL